ncbi:RING finger protein 145 isoform X1 [Triplophysa rosa]|uniref:RING finger protein 145 n=1 Tax=Triplophysa rosa TaxID=992332 RepID=A0A9W7WN94_TRIRA|nr:RING finger protein 145 isoform X1 [Triplophysa rosa]KAI7805328.1 putative RING finger protein 145-like [Triplophysa rosa]
MPRLEEVANVALRVPSILVLDMLYKCDVDSFTDHLKARTEDMLFKYKYVIWNIYYLGHIVSIVLLLLPLGHIIQLYLHVLCALLLYMGHQIVRDYVREEAKYGYDGVLFLDSPALNRFVTALTSQIIVGTLCAFLMRTQRVWMFSAHLLPLLARVVSVPLDWLLTLSSISMIITGAEVAVFLVINLFVPYRLARTAYREIMQIEVTELYRLMAVGVSLWHGFAVPVLFSVFWFVLFGVQLVANVGTITAVQQGPLLYILTSVSECCASPYSLLGLTFVISYMALGLLNLCKFYLGGFDALQNHNVMHRGVTEGVTLLLLALQTGLLDMAALQRCFLLFIILFIVLTSTLQSMSEITEPVVLGLGASRNRSVWKHLRGLSMCGFLLIFPGFMAYKISQFFHMDFWLLILVSSCMLTSLQVTGTLLIYCLFMVEVWRGSALPAFDEIAYYVNGVCRVLEFTVAVCVVAYGAWESLWGEWSWMGASVIIIHSYCNVWLRAQAGWKSFLLRQEAARKINLLPRANAEQLQEHNDVCAICFQDMTSAVITYCGHIYHGSCLRKWLYVQETCPMCHASIKPSSTNQMAGAGDARPQQTRQPPEQQPRPEHFHEEEQGSQGDGPHSTQRTCDEFKMKFSNSDRNSSKGGPQNLNFGANGDSQGLEHPSCSTEQSPSHEKCKDAMDETRELRDAD